MGVGKRGRESTAEQWRDLARKVPPALLHGAKSESEAVLGCIKSTRQWLRRHTGADMLRAHRAAQRGDLPRIPSDTSRFKVDGLAAHHAAAGRLFALCAARLGLITERGDGVDAETQCIGPRAEGARLLKRGHGVDAATQSLWQSWLGHHDEAARHVDEARRRLRSAMEDLGAAHRVLFVIAGRPPGSAPVVFWTSEAEQLLRRAEAEFAVADNAVRRMREAVLLEFFDAWMVLSHLDARAGE